MRAHLWRCVSTDEKEHASYDRPGERLRMIERETVRPREEGDGDLFPVQRMFLQDVGLRHHARPRWVAHSQG